eukprot:CAMPEP_0172304960 /NCGR_PEP_ID=MMETSP1058-20130122/6291_1 /TAXON_ID=83371 /ORGANISM="Detonula confervacea, Strain CCMP 353" /LENGTH=1111 /DNA_ID=CAMNT_0013016367 /DNA_START=17 /DNA_END=3355 /DNA_ORIENTATION=+
MTMMKMRRRIEHLSTSTITLLLLAIISIVSGKPDDAKNPALTTSPPSKAPTFLFGTLSLGFTIPTTATPSSSGVPSGGPSPAPAPPSPTTPSNCHDAKLSNQECKDATNCEWTRNEETGEKSCEFLIADTPPVPSPPDVVAIAAVATTVEEVVVAENCYVLSLSEQECLAATNCEWILDNVGKTLCQDVPIEVSNCHVLSLSKGECLMASNCEWVLDNVGNTICNDVSVVAENCYVLSLSEQECLAATNCEWVLDDVGKTLCEDAVAPSGSALTSLSLSDPTTGNNSDEDDIAPSSAPTGPRVDCLDPNLSKADCKDAINVCEWMKDLNACQAVTSSPSTNPTLEPTNTPPSTLSPTSTSPTSTSPTVEPTGEPTTLKPSNDPTDFPSPSPTTDTPTTDSPTTSPPTTGSPTTSSPTTSTPTTNSPTPRPSSLTPTTLPSFPPTTIIDSNNLDVSKSEVVECLNPNISKEDCKNAANCDWNQSQCEALSLAPTTVPPSTSPIQVDCLNPIISKEDCEDAFSCRWDISECQVVTLSPTTSPSMSPMKSPTPAPTTAKPTMGTDRPTTIPSLDPSAQPSSSPSFPPTTSSAPTPLLSLIPSISTSPTISALPTHSPTITAFPTMGGYEYIRPKRVDLRYVPWNRLDRNTQVVATEHLRYTKETWDNLGTNPIESLRWDDLSDKQKNASIELGFEDEVSWNCWMNHWESFSWKQLYTLKLTPYLTSLGWDLNSWNSQHRDTPMARKGDWSELTVEQRGNASQLCYYKTSYDRLDILSYGFGTPIAKPFSRFVPWKDIEDMLRVQLEQSLGYTELTWNVLRLAEVEQKGWFEFMYYESDTALELGLDDASWDCWINHFDSYGWSDLVRKGLDKHMMGLGWSETAWNEDMDPPATDGKMWKELNETEQLHATELCFAQENWDRIDMTSNDGPFPFPKPKLRYIIWEKLTAEEQQIAQNVLLYEERTWNDVGLADIEKRAWDDLTEYQRPYAIQLGLYQRTWDCFLNHYRATKWDGLSEDVLNAAIVLGWDKDRWSRWSSEPASHSKSWSQLSQEETSAAHVMCHFDVTWPADGSSINLVNQNDNDNIVNDASQVAVRALLPAVLAVSVTAFCSSYA